MKKLLIGLLLVFLLMSVAFAAQADQSYIFTPEELSQWTFSGATVSIVPNTNIVIAYSPELNLEAEYIEALNYTVEITTLDGSSYWANIRLQNIFPTDMSFSDLTAVTIFMLLQVNT